MSERLPETIDPLHLVDNNAVVRGKILLSKLDRLAEMLAGDEGSVAVELFFGRERRLAKIEGRLEAALSLKCQNCLGAVEWPVKHEIKLGVVTSIDQANRLPEEYEPLLIEEGGRILLKNLIEDELLLIIPAYPKHGYDCLSANLTVKTEASEPADARQSSPPNPFSILANLKNIGDL